MHTFSKPLNSYSWFKQNKIASTSLFAALIIGLYQAKQQLRLNAKKASSSSNNVQQKADEQIEDISSLFPIIDFNQKVGVNKEFRRQLASIASILFPNWHTKEAGLLVLHSIFLILRTYLSVVVARLDGRIVRDLVNV
jgi:ATP-binding cassette subfamily D (ALD) long-chain fatty acid import protein